MGSSEEEDDEDDEADAKEKAKKWRLKRKRRLILGRSVSLLKRKLKRSAKKQRQLPRPRLPSLLLRPLAVAQRQHCEPSLRQRRSLPSASAQLLKAWMRKSWRKLMMRTIPRRPSLS